MRDALAIAGLIAACLVIAGVLAALGALPGN